MRVVVLKPFRTYSIGAIIPEMPGGQARTLIARGLIREDIPERQGKLFRSPVNRMVKNAPERKAV